MKPLAAATPFCLCTCIALALAACGAERESQPQGAPPEAAQPAAAQVATPQQVAPPERWLLSEFDWGDSEDTVYETVHYTDGFLCYRHEIAEHCAFVKTRVDGEELLAKFDFAGKRLRRIEVLTPDLDESQASQHLERVWKLLAAYVTRFKGEAPAQAAFPPRETLAPGALRVTHHWKLDDQEIRLVVGRSKDGQKWFTGARFVDPERAGREPAFEPDAPVAQPSATASPTS
jgi:hypothetical protein